MTLEAGTCVRDISPTTSVYLGGYPNVERNSTGVHDPLLASALFLRDGDNAVLLVALDALLMDPVMAADIRRSIAEATGVPEAHVFISCTHSHSCPVLPDRRRYKSNAEPGPDADYRIRFVENVVDAAVHAPYHARAASMAWTSVNVDGVGRNRISPEGARDSEVGLLAVKDSEADRLMAVSMTYSMHPTVMHEDSTLASADFPGYARLDLKETFSEDLVVLYHTGPSGNQSPRYDVKGQTFDEAERLGRLLGQAAARGLSQVPPDAFRDSVPLKGAMAGIAPRFREFPSVAQAEEDLVRKRAAYERLKAEGADHGPVRTAECTVFGGEATVRYARLQQSGALQEILDPYREAVVQVVRIGNTCLTGLPCEIFVEYGLELKEKAARRTFVVSLVNGEMVGYVVTPEAARERGYEASVTVVHPATGPRLVRAALRLIEQLDAE